MKGEEDVAENVQKRKIAAMPTATEAQLNDGIIVQCGEIDFAIRYRGMNLEGGGSKAAGAQDLARWGTLANIPPCKALMSRRLVWASVDEQAMEWIIVQLFNWQPTPLLELLTKALMALKEHGGSKLSRKGGRSSRLRFSSGSIPRNKSRGGYGLQTAGDGPSSYSSSIFFNILKNFIQVYLYSAPSEVLSNLKVSLQRPSSTNHTCQDECKSRCKVQSSPKDN